MTAACDDAPLTIPDRDTARRMRDVLERARFTTTEPLQLAGIDESEVGTGPPAPRRVAVGLRRTAGGGPLETLTRLFLLGVSVPAEQAQRAVWPNDLERWTDAGLLERAGDRVRAPVQLAPVQGRLFVADRRAAGPVRPDHVMGYCGSSATLAKLMIRHDGGSVLDLGTGCGALAVLAAGWAGRVVGTDVNRRAVNIAAFTVRLNGLENVEVLEGDLFAPVQGRRFDVIVCNPPFVLSPETGHLYRDTGRSGDELLRELVRGAPPLLNEGGCCQLVCGWAHLRGQDWRRRLAGWAAGSGCDLWALLGSTDSPAEHAEKWAGGDEEETAEEWAARMDRWVAYCERLGIEQVSHGVLVLRKRSAGPNWACFDRAPNVGGDVGRSLELGLALRDWLAARPGEALLRSRLRVSPNARWHQTLAAGEAGWSAVESVVRAHEGLQFEGGASEPVVRLLNRCRGAETLEEVLGGLEAEMGAPLDRGAAVRVVRELVEQGLLLPAEPAATDAPGPHAG